MVCFFYRFNLVSAINDWCCFMIDKNLARDLLYVGHAFLELNLYLKHNLWFVIYPSLVGRKVYSTELVKVDMVVIMYKHQGSGVLSCKNHYFKGVYFDLSMCETSNSVTTITYEHILRMLEGTS